MSDIDGADPVDHAVVRLGGERPAPTGKTLEQGHLPQRTVALQALGEELRRPLGQLPLASRRRQRGVGDVALEVEVGIVFPRRPAEPAGVRRRQALSIAGQPPEAVRQVAAELLAGRHASVGGRVEDHDRADVHVRAVVDLLELEEGGVDWCEMLAHETPRLARSAAGT